MCYPITNPIRIKDLIIFRNPDVFNIIKSDVESAQKYGVYIGELFINNFIYEYKTTDIIILRNYIRTLNILAKTFGDMFNDTIYTLRLQGLLKDEEYEELCNENIFHWIFHHINHEFNTFVDDIYIYEEFFIYGSEISLELILILYDAFNENIVTALKPYINYHILMRMNGTRTVRWYPYLYDKIFQNLEDLYLPFY